MEERDKRFEKAVREFDKVFREWWTFYEYTESQKELMPEEVKHWRALCGRLKETYDEMSEALHGAIRWEWGD